MKLLNHPLHPMIMTIIALVIIAKAAYNLAIFSAYGYIAIATFVTGDIKTSVKLLQAGSAAIEPTS